APAVAKGTGPYLLPTLVSNKSADAPVHIALASRALPPANYNNKEPGLEPHSPARFVRPGVCMPQYRAERGNESRSCMCVCVCTLSLQKYRSKTRVKRGV